MKLDALIMAGGRGTRMDGDVEKPLLEIDGSPMVERVLSALKGSMCVARIWAATSENAPGTESLLVGRGAAVFRTPGRGYVEDMVCALEGLGLGKTLVVSADLALLSSEDIDFVAGEYEKGGCPAMKVVVPVGVFEELGIVPELELDGLVPSGVNVVDGRDLNGKECELVTRKLSLAVNVNTVGDLEISKLYIDKIDKTGQKEE